MQQASTLPVGMVAAAVSATAPYRAGGISPHPNRDRWPAFVSKYNHQTAKFFICLEFAIEVLLGLDDTSP